MDPIEKLNAKPSKKIMMNKDNMIMKPGGLSQTQNSSQDNFFRKTNTKKLSNIGGLSKSEAYGTIIQIMKSDISQVQEMINDFSHITKMFKLSSKISFTSKRINEIESPGEIKTLIDKIIEESSSAEKFIRDYNCQNANDLILKMGLELNMYDNFVKKLNDLFFIMNLKLNGEENSSAISQENFSKFFVIKIVLEKMLEKSSSTYINDTDSSMNMSQNNFNTTNKSFNLNSNNAGSNNQQNANNFNSTLIKTSRSGFGKFGDDDFSGSNNNNNMGSSLANNKDLNFISNSDKKKLEDLDKIKNCLSINDLLNLEEQENNNNENNENNSKSLEDSNNNSEFTIIKHINLMFKDFLSKVAIGYNDLIKKYSNKKDLINPDISIKFNKSNLSIESLLSQRLSIEKILIEKDKQISSGNLNLTSVPVNNNNEEVEKLKNEKINLEKELENIRLVNKKQLDEIENLKKNLEKEKENNNNISNNISLEKETLEKLKTSNAKNLLEIDSLNNKLKSEKEKYEKMLQANNNGDEGNNNNNGFNLTEGDLLFFSIKVLRIFFVKINKKI